MANGLFRPQIQAISARTADAARHAENAGREAFVYDYKRSTGWGEWMYPDPINFQVTFTRKPAVAYSYEVTDGQEILGTIASSGDRVKKVGRFARCHGGVYDWVQDANGHYTGAYVFVTIDNYSPTQAAADTYNKVAYVDPGYTIHHCWSFFGDAYKGFQDYIGTPGAS